MTRTRSAPVAIVPVDTDIMRGSIALLLPHETVQPPAGDRLATLTPALRGHIQLIIPEVERITARLSTDDIPRYCALACIGEARRKLSMQAGAGPHGALTYARKLARALTALCDHYEALTGQGMCVACDRPMRAMDDTVPYDRVGNSGGARTSRVHAACAQHPRPAR
ncbi:DUF6415 family natural product biosynthesis protein [Streptomyces sp. NPDC029006]|uniref:DUF6415 family natural product biosynthesis protein n=1 Tax=Streptomyces sp. NPDC029006 TaxID=3155467 RepID=UPI0033F6C9BB